MFAIYIDGDNMSPKMMTLLKSKVNELGDIGILKVYRDWSQEDSKKWIELYPTYKFEAVQCFRQPKKQSTDVYLITDLMNDIYTNTFISHVVLATCDSDFVHLCHQIKKIGKKLILIGKDKNMENLCYQFWYYNDFLVDSEPKKKKQKINVIDKKSSNENNVKNENNLKNENNMKNENNVKNDNNLNNETEDSLYFSYLMNPEKSIDNLDLLNDTIDYQKFMESNKSEIYFEDDSSKEKQSVKHKIPINDSALLDFLKLGMDNNYILPISELKKNLKAHDVNKENDINWRKIETELKKFPKQFLVVKKKTKIIVLMVPELLKKNVSKNKIIEIVNHKYSDILKEISIDLLFKNIF